jgi:penicillin amidase
MRAASSDLYDVTELRASDFTILPTSIDQRFWFSADRSIRVSPYGPVISDSSLFTNRSNRDVALRWVGHSVTDEITAFLRASRACTPEAFREALSTFGVSAQNMLFATEAGDIGHVYAATLPDRPQGFPTLSPIRATTDQQSRWDSLQNSRSLPMTLNPPAGFIASANNKPAQTGPTVGFAFSANDRIGRLQEILNDADRVDVPLLQVLQRDVKSNSALRIAALIREEAHLITLTPEHQHVLEHLTRWDGEYTATSVGALAFELTYSNLVTKGFSSVLTPELVAAYQQWSYAESNFARDLLSIEESKRRAILVEAFESTRRAMTRYETWGDMHRLSVGHLLAAVPVLGRFFVETNMPASGSRETIMKTAHGAETKRHDARYGSQSRHISDLSDPDANFFVLLGGQDGWLGSSNYADQVSLWQNGEYIQLPMNIESVKRQFKRRTFLQPVNRTISGPRVH